MLASRNNQLTFLMKKVSLKLTGFEKGGVCPIGMNEPVPVILAESITKLEVRGSAYFRH